MTDQQPRMWRLVVTGTPLRILAVEWHSSIRMDHMSHATLQMKNSCAHSDEHPWPTVIRALARGLRMKDASLHQFAWCEDKDMLALGVANNKKNKTQAMCCAYDLLLVSAPVVQDAPIIYIDPQAYYSDDYVPKQCLTMPSSFANFAVALSKTEGVTGYFLQRREDAQRLF